jgi:hypothetical protein
MGGVFSWHLTYPQSRIPTSHLDQILGSGQNRFFDNIIPLSNHYGASMNINRIARFTLIGFVTLIIIGVLGMLIWVKTGTYPARRVALSALDSTDKVTIAQDRFITFTPVDETEIGLIFYSGGLVEPTAYAPILHKIAEKGVLVVITPMPLNLAILSTNAANSVIDAYPHISTWILAGHSLGGASATIYVENNPTRVDALALWDSYPANSADLSDNIMPVISIFGTTNNIPNTENFNDKKHLLPATTTFIGIEGANHAQFGDYGPQKGDVVASLSLVEQHEQVAEIMMEFVIQNQ